MAKKRKAPAVNVLELDYRLAELPSSQHRAGLAGLVLMVQWLKRQGSHPGVCDVTQLGTHGATLRLDPAGLAALFDEVYAASQEEREEKKPRRNKRKDVIPPLREEVRTDIDPKTGQEKTRTVYVYPQVVPGGAFLADVDPSASGSHGLWVKLWRDVMWGIFRGRANQRLPFTDRAAGKPGKDAAKVWSDLIQPPAYPVALPGTYFIGAEVCNAENVPFRDRARFQFLLHFWPYAAQVYVPAVYDNEGEQAFVGFALAIPDVADLEGFCEELPAVLRERGVAPFRYRPKDSVVDVAVESALDLLRRLRARLALQAGAQATSDLVLGVDVVHVAKQGNNVKTLGVTRLNPEARMIDDYARIRESLWNAPFRKQRLLNVVHDRPWYAGFDGLMHGLPYEQSIGSKAFRHDARLSFRMAEEESATMSEATPANTESVPPVLDCEALVYRVIGIYLQRRLKAKHGLEWSEVKDRPDQLKAYEETKEKVAREAFLAVRSRSGLDFAEYFASTLCSVSQPLNEQQYATLAQSLYADTDKVRTLTMLALSARS